MPAMIDSIENDTLLIVDDDIDLCYLLKKNFKRKFNTVSAHSLKEADRMIKHKLPDIILLDYNLPDGFGTNFLVRMRVEHICLPVIMLTAEFTDEVNKKAQIGGVEAFIQKPFDLLKLENIIDNLLSKKNEL